MLNLLWRIVNAVGAADSFRNALSIMVEEIRNVVLADVVSIYLLDHNHGCYVIAARHGVNVAITCDNTFPLTHPVVDWVGSREEPINLEDVREHPHYSVNESSQSDYKAFLAVPITFGGRVLGVIVAQNRRRRKFTQNEEAFLVTLSAQLANTVAQAQSMGGFESVVRHPESVVRLMGIASVSGIGIGVAFLCQPLTAFDALPQRRIPPEAVCHEVKRFDLAVKHVKADLADLRVKVEDQLTADEMLLFDVYVRLLDDKALKEGVEARIREGFQADSALATVFNRHVLRFEQLSDSYLQERVLDIKDLGERILGVLNEKTRDWHNLPERVVLIGEEITTTALMEFPRDRIAAVVTRQGSVNSHMAIVARSLEIPTVVGVLDLAVSQLLEEELIVDGYSGEVLWHYSERVRSDYLALMEDDSLLQAGFERLRDKPAQTADGTPVQLWLNTGLTAETVKCTDRSLSGVGLYRSEIPFLAQERFPSEGEQVTLYRKQMKAFAPLPVTMRTLDIGGDKILPYFPIREDNPFLGWRGLRISLDHPEIFVVQIRAMLMASAGLRNLRILLPMVTSVYEVQEAKTMLLRAYQGVVEKGYDVQIPELGVMIEVPALAFQIKALAEHVDFLSVGTNDLIQYVLAVDRTNPRVASLYDPYHPAVLRILQQICVDAAHYHVPICVCGEMAGDAVLAILLVAMGYRCLSMNAHNILRVKWALRQVKIADLHLLFAEVSEMACAEAIKTHVQSRLFAMGLGDLMRLIAHRCL